MSLTTPQPGGGRSLVDRLPGFLFPRLSSAAITGIFIALILIGFLIFPVMQVFYRCVP